MNAPDLDAIENGGKRWHGEDHRIVAVRWEPYKPDGQRQMKAKGRWQEQVGSGDYWRWQNCDRPQNLTPATATPDPLSDPCVKALVDLLREASGDLKAYVDADWPENLRAQYPSYQRKWERDMELCHRIDASLRAIEEGGE